MKNLRLNFTLNCTFVVKINKYSDAYTFILCKNNAFGGF